jgi:hypothetical protein
MDFLYPNMLYALFAVAIPVLVHLFNFRRYKKVMFSNVTLLKNLYQQTKKQSELKHLLVLASRILATVALVLAFAGPFIPNNQNKMSGQTQNHISIYLDNSFSMNTPGENGTLFNEAQNMAVSMVESYGNGDKFHLITNEMEAKHHRWFNKVEMIQNIVETKPGFMQQNLSDVMAREKMLRDPETGINHKALLYLLSDFQKSSSFNKPLPADSNLLVRILPLQNNPVSNISIDTLYFQSPVQLPQTVTTLFVKLSNNGAEKVNSIPLRLFIGNELKTVVSTDMEAGETRELEVSFTNSQAGFFQAHVEIEDYPIVYDDRLWFTFQVRDYFLISLISDENPNPYILQLFSSDSLTQIETRSPENVDYNTLPRQDMVILDQVKSLSGGLQKELENYVKSGGQLLIIPSETGFDNSWLNALNLPVFGNLDTVSVRLSDVNKDMAFFKQVFDKNQIQEKNQKTDLPIIHKHFPLMASANSQTTGLLQTMGEKNILTMSILEKGKVFQWAFPLQTRFSQFPQHALFVPVFYQMILQANQQNRRYEQLGSGLPIAVAQRNSNSAEARGKNIAELRQGEQSWIPESIRKSASELNLLNVQWPSDGFFEVKFNNETRGSIAVNYQRTESDFTLWTTDEISEIIEKQNLKGYQIIKPSAEEIKAQIVELDQGTRLWKWFIILAIFFIFVETLLLRFFK